MAPNNAGGYALFVDEFDRGQIEIEVERPFIGVELVEEIDHGRVCKPVVSELLSDVGPVFAFDVGIVVGLVFARPRVSHGMQSVEQIVLDRVIDELAAIVAVESQ